MNRLPRIAALVTVLATLGVWINSTDTTEPRPALRKQLRNFIDTRAELDRTIWAQEMRSQKAESIFVRLWDDLRSSDDKVDTLSTFAFDTITIGNATTRRTHIGEIDITHPASPFETLSHSRWQERLNQWREQGFRLLQSEWHHRDFRDDEIHPRSTFSIELHIANDKEHSRHIVRGLVSVSWPPNLESPVSLDASNVSILSRSAPPPFATKQVKALRNRRAGNVILYDLNRNGRSDILLPSANLLLINQKTHFEERQISAALSSQVSSVLLADFNSDASPDLLYTSSSGAGPRLYLLVGTKLGTFEEPPVDVTPPGIELYQQPTMTTGDIDGDSDLDLWIAQYKAPYVDGSMPTPYYDANDGYPSFLLKNNGQGGFVDVTATSGLVQKRYRRTYSTSFIDLDDDLDLDLIVVSDFAGLDVYLNDGSGHFTDIANRVDNNALFGMGHSFGDFDGNGTIDLYVIGMSSTTARRLEFMGLRRDQYPRHNQMRSQMAFGNRMYLIGPGATLHQPDFRDQIARTGWSWGSTAFDADNDADLDLYVANGFLSRDTATDYCTEFWRHDIYSGDSAPDPVIDLVVNQGLRRGISWNGFEKNQLLLNTQPGRYVNVSFLMGTAIEEDSRNVLSDDFDADGRVDLLVAKRSGHPREKRWDHVILENQGPPDRHWVGVRLYEEGAGFTPIGASVSVKTAARTQVATFVTGESFRSQHANVKHFGLGKTDRIERIEVRWLNGVVRTLERPAIDTYHTIHPPIAPGARSSHNE